ncbi:MAG: LacI family DNA-binding transcriptional regulator [Bacteroidales bacterium]
MPKKISIADIAKSLGVSKTLVSLVVNDKADEQGISKDTQAKVRKKVKEMNYQPNVLARGFRTGKTNTLGLIVSDISNRFFARIARNIEDYAWNKGYNVVICSTDEIIEKELQQISILRERKIEGLIISTSQETPDFFNDLIKMGMPHVLIDRTFEGLLSPSVSVDNYGGARMAIRHLITQGITKIAYIAICPEHISTISNRIKGFDSAMKDAGLTVPEHFKISAPFEDIEQTVKESLQRLYQLGEMPGAIFTMNNNLTSTCLRYLRKLSLQVPRDIALIGFDDVLYFSFTQPTVSAIEQPVKRISEKAFELLMKQIDKKEIPAKEREVILPVDILIRESSVKTI